MVDVGSFQVTPIVLAGNWSKYHSGPVVNTFTVLILALGSALGATVARVPATVLNLCPLSTFALDLVAEINISKQDLVLSLDMLTYNAGPVATAEVSVSVG